MLAGIAILLAVSITATAAEPGSGAAAPALTITYTVTDLATEAGARALFERIVVAARKVCPRYDSVDLVATQLSWTCQRRAIAGAVRQIHSPRLAAIQALRAHHG